MVANPVTYKVKGSGQSDARWAIALTGQGSEVAGQRREKSSQ